MKIGVVYPQMELAGDAASLRRIGTAVEELGYNHLVLFDHVVGAQHDGRDPPLWGPYDEHDPFHDPFTAFAHLAAITRRIELLTGVLVLPQRQTALVAKQAADIARMSGGRLRLGVGTGWNYVEYDVLGSDYHTRGARLDEQIELLRRLWSDELVSFAGRFHNIERANINIRPAEPVPIYCGGFSEPAFRRGARVADGFIFAGVLDNLLPALGRVKELLDEEGRAGADFKSYMIHTDDSTGLPVAETLDVLRRWRDAGGTHASVMTMGLGFSAPEQHVNYLAELRSRLSLASG